MVNTKNIRKSICEIGKLLYDRGYIDASGGNISVRDGDKVYLSPRQSGEHHQWNIEEDSIIVTDMCKVPIIGDFNKITRESVSHYYIYNAFPEVKAIVHAHPPYMMSFGSAHMDIPAVSEGTRCVIGTLPVTNIEESVPGSAQQAERVVENFKQRRKIDPECGLICNIPFHGVFSAASDLNYAFLYVEVSEINCKILINRQIMFGNDPRADLTIHHQITREEINSISQDKDVCEVGYRYKDPYGNEAVYLGEGQKKPVVPNVTPDLVSKITEEVLKKLRNS
jgi:L-fuculose-phosphate aldolase